MSETIKLQRGKETKTVTRLLWENMKAGNTYGWQEVVETPAELLALQAKKAANVATAPAATVVTEPTAPATEIAEPAAPVVTPATAAKDAAQKTVAEQIAELEEQKKTATGQAKANITKQIKALQEGK